MTWTLKHFTLWRLARLLLPCFCLATFPVAARADLTPAQVQEAVYNAISTFSNQIDAFYTIPYNDSGDVDLSSYLQIAGDPRGIASRFETFMQFFVPYFKQIGASSNDISRVVSLLSGLSGLGEITNGWGYSSADTLHYQLDTLQYYLQGLWSNVPYMESLVDEHGSELLVSAPDLYEETVNQGYTLSSVDQHIQDLQLVLESLRLGDVGSNVSNIVELLDPSGTESLPDDSDVDLPEGDDELEELLVTPPSTTWTQVDYDLSFSSGSPVIVLWEDMELAGYSLPDGKIDLSTGQMARGVAIIGRISRTLWWLAYYTGLFLLLRREYVYYTSLGSSEGAA